MQGPQPLRLHLRIYNLALATPYHLFNGCWLQDCDKIIYCVPVGCRTATSYANLICPRTTLGMKEPYSWLSFSPWRRPSKRWSSAKVASDPRELWPSRQCFPLAKLWSGSGSKRTSSLAPRPVPRFVPPRGWPPCHPCAAPLAWVRDFARAPTSTNAATLRTDSTSSADLVLSTPLPALRRPKLNSGTHTIDSYYSPTKV